MKPNLPAISALLFLAAQLPLCAQRVTTHLLTFAPASLPESFQTYYQTYYQTTGGVEQFTASGGTLGLPAPYAGPRDFALYGSAEDAASSKQKEPVASVSLPEKCDLVLLVCSRAEDDKVTLAAHNLDSSDLKSGDYRVFNFSKSTISMTMGDQSLELEPGKDSIVRDSKWHAESFALPIKIATVANGKSRTVYSSLREHAPKDRTLMFLFDGSHPSRPITFTTFNAEAAPNAD